jgi:hypothetical protein
MTSASAGSRRPAAAHRIILTLVCAGSAAPLAAQTGGACTLPAQAPNQLGEGALQLAWRAEPAAIAVGKPFALMVWTCPREARLVKVDATMPEHRHGMNYRPSIAAQEAGTWRVQGLLWHMPGRWELRFDVQAEVGAEAPQVLRQSVELR